MSDDALNLGELDEEEIVLNMSDLDGDGEEANDFEEVVAEIKEASADDNVPPGKYDAVVKQFQYFVPDDTGIPAYILRYTTEKGQISKWYSMDDEYKKDRIQYLANDIATITKDPKVALKQFNKGAGAELLVGKDVKLTVKNGKEKPDGTYYKQVYVN